MAVLVTTTVLIAGCNNPGVSGTSWTMWGHDYDNSHNQRAERTITAANAAQLKPKWVAELKGDISATPTIADGTVYIPDWGGYLSALDAKTGAVKWQVKVSDMVGFSTYFSRTAPAISGDSLIIGFNTTHSHGGLLNPGGQPGTPTTTAPPGTPTTTMPDDHGDHDHGDEDEQSFEGAWMASVSRADGTMRWVKQVEKRPYAAITGNPVVRNGRVVVGVSSNEWDFTGEPGFVCCSSRGSLVSLDARTGNLLWQTYTIPDTAPCTTQAATTAAARGCTYSGGSVASTPAIDTLRNTVFVGTGQNYTVPDSVRDCIVRVRAQGKHDIDCLEPDNHFDSLLAIDFTTGRIKWAKNVLPYDPWNAACILTPGAGNCPAPYGPDADLISSPNLFTIGSGLRRQDVVGSGQKSGVYWAFDRETGAEVWHTDVGPGSVLGGIEWGTAVDDQNVYAPIGNPFGTPYAAPDGTAISGGSWAALDRNTGKIKWQVQAPDGPGSNAALGSPAIANGVMFGATIEGGGENFFALEAATGKVLWKFNSGGSSVASPAIADGVVYWGTGYGHLSIAGAKGSNKFYAFSVNGA